MDYDWNKFTEALAKNQDIAALLLDPTALKLTHDSNGSHATESNVPKTSQLYMQGPSNGEILQFSWMRHDPTSIGEEKITPVEEKIIKSNVILDINEIVSTMYA